LGERESTWREVFYRESTKAEDGTGEVCLVDLNPFDLLSALQKVLEKAPKQISLEFSRETLSVKDRIQSLLDRFSAVESLQFDELYDPEEGRNGIIVTFLALLEVVRLGLLRLIQAETPDQSGTIRIVRTGNIVSALP
jgi:segregation and condensation protein A